MTSAQQAIMALAALLAACSTSPPVRMTQSEAPGPAPSRPHVTWAEISAQPPAPPDARVSYGADPLQFGELRLPPGAGPFPVAVVIHGGCWRAAYDLAHVAPVAAALAGEGIATWSIEYRRVGDPGGGWPGTFEDVARAVDHVRELAHRFPLDTSRVVLVGHSAGGQLALWAGSRRTGERGPIPGEAPLRAAGVVALAPITDLAAYGAAPGGCNSAVTPLMGGTGQEVPDRYAAVSPVARIPLGVPAAVVHGAGDPTVPISASRAFVERARAAGDAAELREVPDAGHFDVVAPFAPAWRTVLDAVREVVGRR